MVHEPSEGAAKDLRVSKSRRSHWSRYISYSEYRPSYTIIMSSIQQEGDSSTELRNIICKNNQPQTDQSQRGRLAFHV